MDIAHAGLKQKPFHTQGTPVVVVHYQSEQAAQSFLQVIASSDRGIGLFIGPESSGKRTVINQFVQDFPANRAVAVVDASRLNVTDFLATIHARFGNEIVSTSADDSLNELKEFVVQRARNGHAPLLVVNNINEMHPSALRVLCVLAEVKVQGKFALRMILVSSRPSFNIVHAPAMIAIAARTLSAFEMGPMTPRESMRYLYVKLRSSGCVSPDSVLSADICEELHKASRGWPGIIDGLAAGAIERARNWPIRHKHIYPPAVHTPPQESPGISAVREDVRPEARKLYLTLNRETLEEFDLDDSKILIGRSELCDVSVNSRFVSKYHAMLIRETDAMHLVDLNSTNGTFVNSRRVQSTVLQHEDVISLGNHGIKLIAPAYRAQAASKESDLAETMVMKSLEGLPRSKDDASEDEKLAEKRKI